MSSERLAYIKNFLDTLYTDDKFLHDLLECCSDPAKNDGLKLLKEKGFTFKKGDIDLIDQLRAAKEDLHILRLAGGAYRFHSNEAGFWELMIDSTKKAIYIDSKPVQNLHVDHEGNVCFTHSDYSLQLKFQFPWVLGQKQPDHLGFSGKIGKGTTTKPIQGDRHFPGGNAFDSKLAPNSTSPSSQTAKEDVMVAVAGFRDDLADKSLSVAIDLVEQRKHAEHVHDPEEYALFGPGKPRPSGDELAQGANAIITGAGFAIRSADIIGGPWGTIVGGVVGAAGSLLTTSVKNRIVENGKLRMTDRVLCYKLPGIDKIVAKETEKMANGVPETELKNEKYLDQLRKQFRDETYIPWARDQMDDTIHEKHSLMHKFWRTEFLTTYAKALETRFDEHMPPVSLDSLFKFYLDRRWGTEVALEKLKRLAADLKQHDDAYKRKLAEIDKQDHLSTEEREEQKKDAKKEFEKEKEEIEKKRRPIEEQTEDIKERVEKKADEALIKAIKADTDEKRRLAEVRVNQEKARR
ncbi:hypothetical protein ASPWEDRAFT_171328 [Aspergillus wentii DTO 134E9]|uniref:Uncharacterized protein n=1 Tax=Aspergillus wentii DTO 134E9 TaxID=1073089 RepID=A0A1L9RSG2_ASPWE|nr:uncharacterized protein ASPWEDRAFT_171328 [Aspergillus wentii DTO 134E9]OJJ37865.1 hypothetical protein ASPWEDRAFT_171328 [Aspergillus wentii DTO 134E9]